MDRPHRRSVLGGAIHNYMEKRARPKRKAKWEKESLLEELKDYDKYEKELKKRKGKKRSFSDREIDPKKIADARRKAEKMGLYKPKKKIRSFKPKKSVTGMLEAQGY